MPPYLYPINHYYKSPKVKKYTINENNEECIPLKSLSKNYNNRFYRSIPSMDKKNSIIAVIIYK